MSYAKHRLDPHGSLSPGAAACQATTRLEADTDPTDALLLRIDPPRATTEPTALLALATAALRSPR